MSHFPILVDEGFGEGGCRVDLSKLEPNDSQCNLLFDLIARIDVEQGYSLDRDLWVDLMHFFKKMAHMIAGSLEFFPNYRDMHPGVLRKVPLSILFFCPS